MLSHWIYYLCRAMYRSVSRLYAIYNHSYLESIIALGQWNKKGNTLRSVLHHHLHKDMKSIAYTTWRGHSCSEDAHLYAMQTWFETHKSRRANSTLLPWILPACSSFVLQKPFCFSAGGGKCRVSDRHIGLVTCDPVVACWAGLAVVLLLILAWSAKASVWKKNSCRESDGDKSYRQVRKLLKADWR